MKLIIESGELLLPQDASFELAFNHPFFEDGAEISFPFTLPACDHNLALLGFPNLLTRRNKYNSSFRAILEHELFQFSGDLIVDNYDSDEGITCSLSLKEGALYRDYQDMNIKDLLIMSSGSSSSKHGHVVSSTMLPSASIIMTLYINGEIALFPGMTAFPVAAKAGDDFQIIVNETTTDESGKLVWKNTASRIYTNGSSDYYEVPAQYAIMPFFKLWRLLELVFKACGFTVSYNVFKEREPYDKLTVVTACVDSLCERTSVPFRDMVPSITVGELIAWLRDKFAAVVTCSGRSVQISFLENDLNSLPDLDLTPYALKKRSVIYPPTKRVVLNVETSAEGAAPAAETLQKLYSSTAGYREVEVLYDTTSSAGFYYKPALGQYQYNKGGEYTRLGTDAFKYDRDNSEETEEHSASDQFLPMRAYKTADGKDIILPFIGEAAHFHTNINGDPGSEDSPLLLCWDVLENGKHYGTVYPYSLDDLSVIKPLEGLFSLTPEGLYKPHWKSYNELILNGAPEISLELDLLDLNLNSFDITKPKLLDGIKVICRSLVCSVDSRGCRVATGTFIPVVQYEDRLIDQTPEPSLNLKWELVDTFDAVFPGMSELFEPITGTLVKFTKEQRIASVKEIDGMKVLHVTTDGLTDYTMEDAPIDRPVMMYQEALSRERTVTYYLAQIPYVIEKVYTYREYFRAVVKK